jgi:hypothetical protein
VSNFINILKNKTAWVGFGVAALLVVAAFSFYGNSGNSETEIISSEKIVQEGEVNNASTTKSVPTLQTKDNVDGNQTENLNQDQADNVDGENN